MVEINQMSKREREQYLQGLVKLSHFDYDEVVLLEDMFSELATTKNGVRFLSRQAFRDVLGLAFEMCDDLMMDRTFHSFCTQKSVDGKLTFEMWVLGMSCYLRGSIDEKIDFCFRVYASPVTGEISREEMYQLLSRSIVKSPSEEDREEGIRDLVEIVLKKMDISTPKTQTSKISKADFATSVKANRLLLEVFGPCLPTQTQASKFITMKMLQTIKAQQGSA